MSTATKIQELEQERERLKSDLDACRQECLETAKMIFELRQLLKGAQEKPREERPEPEKPASSELDDGPEQPLSGRVMFIDKDQGFFLLNLGKKDGVKVGYRFEVVREVKEAGKQEPGTKRLAVGRVVGLLGAEETHAKLKVLEGDLLAIQLDDEAIAFRKTKGVTRDPKKEDGDKKQYKIRGKTGDVYLLNYSGLDGATPGTLVYIYREKKLVARMHIDKVEKDYSIARVVEGSQAGELQEGDGVELQELRILVVGRIKHVHRKNGIYLDFGTDQGAKSGMRMQVSRQGKRIGELVLDQVERWWATAKPAGETDLDDLKEHDFVEEIP